MLFTFLRPIFVKHWKKLARLVALYGVTVVSVALIRKAMIAHERRRQRELLAEISGPKKSASLQNLMSSRVEPEKDFKFWLSHKSDPGNSQRKFRILALDGGGVRGVYTAQLLVRLTKRFPNLLDHVDLITGSSTGGLLALLLAGGYTPEQCKQFYMRTCPIIFHSTWWRRLNPFNASFSDRYRYRVFDLFGQGLKFSDLTKYVVITAFRLDDGPALKGETRFHGHGGWRPALFTNLPKHHGRVEPDLDLYLRDAAMRTTAAPTYFPTYQQYCDGAIFANNPSLAAMSVALSNYPDVLNTNNCTVLSLGSGLVPRAIPFTGDHAFTPMHHKGRHDWGVMGWVHYILDLLMDGTQYMTQDVMHMLLGDRFYYLNGVLGEDIDLADVSKMDTCVKLANEVDIEPASDFIREHFDFKSQMSGSKSHPSLNRYAGDDE